MFHILLIDDEEPLLASLSYYLIKEGYKVTTAADGVTALKVIEKKMPDLIILDLLLPEMDGIELFWRIKAFSDVPILMLTAKDHEADKVWGLKSGADDYVTKPFSTRELIARIEAILRRTYKCKSVRCFHKLTHPPID
jgi:DNA-binding response OmpR family regulator